MEREKGLGRLRLVLTHKLSTGIIVLFLSVGIKLYFISRQEPFVLYLLPVRTEMIREHKCRLLVDIVSVLHWHWGLSLIGISREKFKSLSVVTRKNQILCPTSPVSPVLMDLIKSSSWPHLQDGGQDVGKRSVAPCQPPAPWPGPSALLLWLVMMRRVYFANIGPVWCYH